MKSLMKNIWLVSVIIILASCEKFLDVNTNRNRSLTASVELALPSAIANITFWTGGPAYGQYAGYWAQYWTHQPTYGKGNFDQYTASNSDFDRSWGGIYAGTLEDLKYIVQEGTAKNRPNYVAIAKFLQAYSFQLLTDVHGDVPYTQALLGDNKNISPVYDSQQSIYDNLIVLINEGLALVDLSAGAVTPKTDDLIYGGKMQKWVEFANTLKLRIYLRQSNVRPAVAQAGIQDLYNKGAAFITNGNDAGLTYTQADQNRHPMYAYFQWQGTEAFVASATIVDFMVNNGDSRIESYFIPATAGPTANQYVGIIQGQGLEPKNFPANAAITWFSRTVLKDEPNSDYPVFLINAAESYFLQSEAAARGWAPGNAEALYEQGIQASFDYWHVGGDAPTYIAEPAIAFPVAGSLDDKLNAIITQKWVAYAQTNNVESWNEWRRTGYPVFTPSEGSVLPPGKFPVRFPYPSSELTRNPNTTIINDLTVPVWWDVN